MILYDIARYSLLLQLAATSIVVPSVSGARIRRISFAALNEDMVSVWMAVPVKTDGCCVFDDATSFCPDDIYADQPRCHFFREECEGTCAGQWMSANETAPSPTTAPTEDSQITSPTWQPTILPGSSSTQGPTTNPTPNPTPDPTSNPTFNPAPNPTLKPSSRPTSNPTSKPSSNPTSQPSSKPTKKSKARKN